ncbi:hypothetical protein BV378_14060 [Nostoc sp. RF31YmG]|jgi:hypothetical protein|nr:hypothetical protein BV378_14060 [Nostoc sp. RF31YmG]
MKGLRTRFASWLYCQLVWRVVARRPADFVVGADNADGAYLLRWWLIPRNRALNVYLHCFLRSDDDRALHDHPWAWCSLLLKGSYVEHTIRAGGIHSRRVRQSGGLRCALPSTAHRVEILPGEGAWTIFITGPRMRLWGFHCPEQGWINYRRFTAAREGKPGELGPGCDA